MTLKPLNGRVIIRRTEKETKSPGGIVIPENAQKQSQRGEVLAVSSGRDKDGKEVAPLVRPGHVVLFNKYAGEEYIVNNDDRVLILKEEDLLGILEA